ncbi:MAG: hypothetical protein F4121_04815 [Acidimicrobiia bacterium]|nr:hypothetical protein [Acidimicrobiia bacterium]MYC46363.1 hypothetical protein [Acidimicrobiia bacterium]MYI19415.1 hypothetical protein [Acidimicrobiia bacterium]
MPAIRKLLRHAKIETAGGKRKCHRKQDEHKILKGDACLVIRDADGRAKNYCVECALPILDQARDDLNALAAELGLNEPGSVAPSAGSHHVRGSTAAGREP